MILNIYDKALASKQLVVHYLGACDGGTPEFAINPAREEIAYGFIRGKQRAPTPRPPATT